MNIFLNLVIFSIIAIGIAAVAFIYFNYQKRKKANKKMEMAEKHRISLNQLEALKDMGLVAEDQYNTARSEIQENLDKLNNE